MFLIYTALCTGFFVGGMAMAYHARSRIHVALTAVLVTIAAVILLAAVWYGHQIEPLVVTPLTDTVLLSIVSYGFALAYAALMSFGAIYFALSNYRKNTAVAVRPESSTPASTVETEETRGSASPQTARKAIIKSIKDQGQPR